MRRLLSLAVLAALCLPAAAAHAEQVQAGVGVVDATYRVGASAGQYATTRDNGPGEPDPHFQSAKNQPSYGIQSRMSVNAIVTRAGAGEKVALVKTDLYIAQDMLWRRAAMLLEQKGIGIGRSNLTMTVNHSHSSPYYSSTAWGAWAFQDVFDLRFYEYMAQKIAAAVVEADKGLTPVRVSARTGRLDKLHRHSFGPAKADDGSPAGYPDADTETEYTVVRFDDISGERPKPLVTLLNYSGHPEFLDGNDLLSGEYTGVLEREIVRATRAPLVFTQNAVGTAEPEQSKVSGYRQRLEFNHRQYGQMEWGATKLADGVLDAWKAIGEQSAGGEKLVPWFSDAPVEMESRWFPGPIAHPYPGVSNCRTDQALQGNPGIPVVGLPDCNRDLDGSPLFQEAKPVFEQTPFGPELTTDDVQALGVPVPENYSAPSYTALQETVGVHLQAFRIGDILFPVCACEQWKDQSRNIQTRTDKVPDNEHLGYDWSADCRADAAACKRMWHQVHNDATGWNEPEYAPYAESEPADVTKIKGNYTHDDIDDYGGKAQSDEYADKYGYALTVPISMANDYNGYIATYREYQRGDHYRKALTAYGPHSSDYMATRLVRMGQVLKGDSRAEEELDREPLNPKEIANQAQADLKATALGTVAEAAVPAYEAALPDDSGEPAALVQPKDIERFGAAFFQWRGGSNYVDIADVRVERRVDGAWRTYGDGAGGEVPVHLKYPGSLVPGTSQEWKWTATFEAFVGRSSWTAADGSAERATPSGQYRFVVDGRRRAGGKTVAYEVASAPFRVSAWRGITVEDLRLDAGKPSFRVGPGGDRDGVTMKERDAEDKPIPVRGAPPGPIDYPDTYSSPLAPRFIDGKREVVRDLAAKDDDSLWEWYCLACSFRPWLDAGDAESATVTFLKKSKVVARVPAARVGDRWVADRVVAKGETAVVEAGAVRDAWGNTNGAPSATVGP